MFIVLIVIGCLSIVVIITGFIYLVCDRKRSRRGEYITNATSINSDLEMAFDNPAMTHSDKGNLNGKGAQLLSMRTDDDGDIVPINSFTEVDLMNCEVEDTHL